MKTLNIEVHCFTKSEVKFSNTNAYKVMELLKELELFPQVYQDADDGNLEQKISFVNMNTGISIRSQHDRLVLRQAFIPHNSDSFDESQFKKRLEEVWTIMRNYVTAINNVFEINQKFYRMALVTRFFEVDKYDQLFCKLNESVAKSLPWNKTTSSQAIEINFRTGYRFEHENEFFNSVVTTSDVLMDVSSNINTQTTKDCMIFEIDINTIPEKTDERFDVNNMNNYSSIFIERQGKIISEINDFIEGN